VGEVEVVEPLGLVVWVVLVEHPARVTSSATANGRTPKRPARLCGGLALAGVVTGVSMSAHYPMYPPLARTCPAGLTGASTTVQVQVLHFDVAQVTVLECFEPEL
jgi:hypothetical protein